MNDEVQGYVDQYIRHIALERRLSEYTVRNYTKALKDFFIWLKADGWDGEINSVKERSARSYVIEEQKRLSRRSIHNRVSALREFFKYGMQHEFATSNPFRGIVLPKLGKPLPKFLTEKQMKDLLNGPMSLLETEKVSAFVAWRDLLTMHLLYGGGFRVSELVQLNYGDIEFGAGVARVLGKGNKERMCPVGKGALECLKQFKGAYAPDTAPEAPVLVKENGERFPVRQVQLMLKKYLALAELPNDLSPHKVRHSYATHMLNKGADIRVVKDLLGHASLSTTQMYTHVTVSKLKEAHKLAHPRA